MKSKFFYSIEIYFFQSKFTYESLIYSIKVNFSNLSIFFKSKFNLMNRSLFLISKHHFIKWKFILQNQILQNLIPRKSMFCFHCGIELATEGSFYFGCVRKNKISLIGDNTLTEREVIGFWFRCGYGYEAIIHLLKTHCDISLSGKH